MKCPQGCALRSVVTSTAGDPLERLHRAGHHRHARAVVPDDVVLGGRREPTPSATSDATRSSTVTRESKLGLAWTQVAATQSVIATARRMRANIRPHRLGDRHLLRVDRPPGPCDTVTR